MLYTWEMGLADQATDAKRKYGIGIWSYSKSVEALDGSGDLGQNSGIYFLLDQMLSKKFSFFVKHGQAAPRYNKFSTSSEADLKF